MGLFNKLKNALFEIEEVEIETPKEDKVVIKDEESVNEKEPEKKEVSESPNLTNDRDLFKVENTFNFPDFDETEFEINYEPPKTREREVKENVLNNSYEYEEKIKIRREQPVKHERERNIRVVEHPKKAFKPSPVISPVYGVLDKNYTKDDIVTVERSVKVKHNSIDVDMVRKKAFGTLEEDLEKTLNEPVNNFFKEDTKSIDELLNDSIDDTIELKYDKPKEEIKKEDLTKSIEEELDNVEELFDDTKEEKKAKVEETDENESLENDLFDLIDSMYDNKEEE